MNDTQSTFVWVPGNGPDAAVLSELRKAGPRPRVLPGEAWFMSEKRKMFDEFSLTDVNSLPVKLLKEFLWDAASGPLCFPEVAAVQDEWVPWFRHLLPVFIERGHERHVNSLLESAITAYLLISHSGPLYPDSALEVEARHSLCSALMNSDFWRTDTKEFIAPAWIENCYGADWPRCAGVLSASLVCSLLYVDPDQLAGWTQSIANVESACFRAHLLRWLELMLPSLQEGTFVIESMSQELDWQNSFLLKNPHVQIGADTQRLFASLIRNQLSEDRIIEWAEQISAVRALGPALDGARTADNVLGLLWG